MEMRFELHVEKWGVVATRETMLEKERSAEQ